jgi:hypothetical protein
MKFNIDARKGLGGTIVINDKTQKDMPRRRGMSSLNEIQQKLTLN